MSNSTGSRIIWTCVPYLPMFDELLECRITSQEYYVSEPTVYGFTVWRESVWPSDHPLAHRVLENSQGLSLLTRNDVWVDLEHSQNRDVPLPVRFFASQEDALNFVRNYVAWERLAT